MKKYRIGIWKDFPKKDLLTLIEMRRRHFTKREWDMVIREMFDWAASSCIYDELTAKVYCDDKEVMVIKCKTRQEGSEIYSVITANDKPVRRMNVAC